MDSVPVFARIGGWTGAGADLQVLWKEGEGGQGLRRPGINIRSGTEIRRAGRCRQGIGSVIENRICVQHGAAWLHQDGVTLLNT